MLTGLWRRLVSTLALRLGPFADQCFIKKFQANFNFSRQKLQSISDHEKVGFMEKSS
jgi:hypothetical protein